MKFSIIGLSLEGLLSPNAGWKECAVKRRGAISKQRIKEFDLKKVLHDKFFLKFGLLTCLSIYTR